MGKHTLGPWHWHWRYEDGVANGSVYAMPREGHAYAVAMCPRYQTREQWEADAALIAAAPEMLAALKAVVEFYSYAEFGPIAQARAVIAKAEGTAS